MRELSIKKMHEELKKTKTFVIPGHLLPAEKGYNLISWAQELLLYYQEEGIIVQPFDELPAFKLSSQPGLDISIQDVHKFIISDLSLIPLEIRKKIVSLAVSNQSAREGWQEILPILLQQLHHMGRETVVEELTWKFSPVAELLWVVTWFFMERDGVAPPAGTMLVSHRFPYYMWLTAEHKFSLWEPENPLCRWEWLAFDLYNEWLKKSAEC